MLELSWQDEEFDHDYLGEDDNMDDLGIPCSNVDDHGAEGDSEGEDEAKSLDVQIAKAELKVVTAK